MVNGRIAITSTTTGLAEWQNRVALAAQTVAAGRKLYGAITLRAHFFLQAPKAVKKAAYHLTFPDLDKLTRAIGDALSDVLYDDDKQIIEAHTRKDYAIDRLPGVEIEVRGSTDPPILRSQRQRELF